MEQNERAYRGEPTRLNGILDNPLDLFELLFLFLGIEPQEIYASQKTQSGLVYIPADHPAQVKHHYTGQEFDLRREHALHVFHFAGRDWYGLRWSDIVSIQIDNMPLRANVLIEGDGRAITIHYRGPDEAAGAEWLGFPRMLELFMRGGVGVWSASIWAVPRLEYYNLRLPKPGTFARQFD